MEQLCKLFVGGLNVETTNEGLRNHFELYGQVTECIVVQNEQLQRSRCFGFVTFSRIEEADAAMAAKPHIVDGKTVDLKRAVAREDAGKPEALAKVKKIFIGGLKDDMQENDLNEYFAQFGVIEKTEVITDKNTGKKRGFGFIHFEDNDSADKAVVLKFHTINGHKVEVKKALTKQEMQATGVSFANRGGRGTGRNPNSFVGGRGGYGSYGDAFNSGYGSGYEQGYSDQLGNYGCANGYSDFGGGYGQHTSGYGPMKGNTGRSGAPYPRGVGPGYNRGGY